MAFTFFFRDHHTLNKVVNFFVPEVTGYSKVKIWDAGCAMGPEPYTFAIILAQKMGKYNFRNVEIIASDIDETNTFGTIITNGIYPESDLKRIPPEVFRDYFSKADENGYYKIDENIRSRVHFVKHDLLTLDPVDTGFHLIICKNVLLHFQAKERVEVMKMFHSVLAPKGLFVTE
jgi:chemotaxis protein methyltransferase CheR